MQPATTAPRRWPCIVVLLGSLVWLGLVAGAAAGAAWLVPEGSGLAGPAIALGYGVAGAAAGLVLGAALAWRAGYGLLRASAVVAAVLALVAVGAVAWRAVAAQAERSAGALLPPPSGFRIESRLAESVANRSYRELTIDAGAWTARARCDG